MLRGKKYIKIANLGAPLAQLVECRTLDCGFESHQGRGILFLRKTLYLHCSVLIQINLGKRFDITEKLLTVT